MQSRQQRDPWKELFRFFCFNFVNASDASNPNITYWTKYGHPTLVLGIYVLLIGVLYGMCYGVGQIYDILLYEDEKDRDPQIWPYKGWILIVSFMATLSWLNFILFYVKKRCFTATLV